MDEKLFLTGLLSGIIGILLYMLTCIVLFKLDGFNLNGEDFAIYVLIIQSSVIWYSSYNVLR